jgi:AcrR family transcriptional regulator
VVKAPEERRRDILDAALRLFAEKGFEETTVQQIAEAAHVATGTVYLYFPSKDHVLLGLHEDFHKDLQERFTALANEAFTLVGEGEQLDYRSWMHGFVDAVADHCRQNLQLTEVIARYEPRHEFRDGEVVVERGFVEFLTRLIDSGTQLGFVHASDPEMMAYLLEAAISHTFGHAVAFGVPQDLDRLVAQTKEFFEKALARPSSEGG